MIKDKYMDWFQGCKKFEPWIATSEARKSRGMAKPKNLQEALDQLAEVQVKLEW